MSDETYEVERPDDAAILRTEAHRRWGDRPGTRRPSPDEAARQVLDRLQGDPAWQGRVLPTEDQLATAYAAMFADVDEVWDPRLDELQGALEPALPRALGGPPAGRAVVASAGDRELGAGVREIAGIETAYLIVFHPGLTHFTSLMTRALVACLPPDHLERPYELAELSAYVDARVRAEPERTIFPFAEAAVCTALDGDPWRAGSAPVEPDRRAAMHTLWTATDMFVLGHEYAHYELAHTERGPRRPALDRLDVVRTSLPFWQEAQADELGLSISSHAFDRLGVGLGQSSLGAWMFFSAWEALEIARRIVATGSRAAGEASYRAWEHRPEDDSHPAPSTRRMALYRRLMDHAGGRPENITQLWMGCDLALQYLRDHTAAHAEAVAPAGARGG